MSAWQIDDKQWMQTRNEQWKHIRRSVNTLADDYERSDIQAFKDYFLTGTENRDDFPIELFLKLWFHPDESESNWQALCDAAEPIEFENALSYIMSVAVGRNQFYGLTGEKGQRLYHFLFPKGYQRGGVQFKGVKILAEQRSIIHFFKLWIGAAGSYIAWLEDADAEPWPCTLDYWFDSLTDVGLTWPKHEDQHIFSMEKISGLGDARQGLHKTLYAVDHYVEPRGLPGEEVAVCHFAEHLKHELNTRTLPPDFKKLWKHICSDAGRAAWTSKDGYSGIACETPVWHRSESCQPVATIKTIVAAFVETGFVDEPFKKNRIQIVDLGQHVHFRFAKKLGYKTREPMPAYRYRLTTNTGYTNTDTAEIGIDVLVFIPHKTIALNDATPAVMLVPRPKFQYNGSHPAATIYKQNSRLILRVLAAQHGMDFKTYSDFSAWQDQEAWLSSKEAQLSFDAKYPPLKTWRTAILDAPEHDFPTWTGKPLPID